MISAVTVGTELLAFAAVGGGLYLFLRDKESPAAESAEESSSVENTDPLVGWSGSASDDTVPIPRGGIIGLGAPTDEKPSPPEPAVEPMPNLDTVGANVEDYVPVTKKDVPEITRPLEDELSWAAGALSDLQGCDGTLIADKNGKVRWAEGPLVENPEDVGDSVRKLIAGNNQITVVDVKSLSFLKDDAMSAAIVPIGSDGAVLVVASSESGFFCPLERRTAQAVGARLEFALAMERDSSSVHQLRAKEGVP